MTPKRTGPLTNPTEAAMISCTFGITKIGRGPMTHILLTNMRFVRLISNH